MTNTAFRTRYGHHKLLVIPFGITKHHESLHRIHISHFKPYLGKFIVNASNITLVYFMNLLEYFRIMLQVSWEGKPFAKPSKFEFV